MAKITKDNTKEINGITTDIAVILNKLLYIEADIKEIKEKLESDYVTREEYEPVKKLVYGLVSVILLAVIGAVVTLVVRK